MLEKGSAKLTETNIFHPAKSLVDILRAITYVRHGWTLFWKRAATEHKSVVKALWCWKDDIVWFGGLLKSNLDERGLEESKSRAKGSIITFESVPDSFHEPHTCARGNIRSMSSEFWKRSGTKHAILSCVFSGTHKLQVSLSLVF
jgi:hypothetical protein